MSYSKSNAFEWCEGHFQEQLDLLRQLAAIPAPSHHEEKRADFIKNWLIGHGAKNVILDDAKNVILSLGPAHAEALCVMAHTDVVFPDLTPLPVREENGRLYAPGAGDDTANVAALMMCTKYLITHPEVLREPMLLVFNSCEEGLGNLKGVRQIMADHGHRIHSLVSFDLQSNSIVSRAVGSERWKITAETAGGHSYSDFGSPNAIVPLSRLVDKLYSQAVPVKENTKTTYNVGLISGGTSVNTIAQSAQMVYEYRSDDRECLSLMAHRFEQLVADTASPGVRIHVESLGVRPCGDSVDKAAHNALLSRCHRAITAVTGETVPFCSASTDANIPLSMGIPAATFGLYTGGGAHTREEYVNIDSLTPGLKIAMAFILQDITAQ